MAIRLHKTAELHTLEFSARALGWLDSVLSSRRFVLLTYIWFLTQASFFALFILLPMHSAVAPDEIVHFRFIRYYAEHSWDPFLDAGLAEAGVARDVSRTESYLYHYLLSWPYRLVDVFGSNTATILTLRGINVAFALANLEVLRRTARRTGMPAAHANMAVFVVSNLMMYVALAGAISYDNLANLCASLVIYSFIRLYDGPATRWIWIFGLLTLLAPLIKFTLVPLVATIWLVGFLHLTRLRKSGSSQWRGALRRIWVRRPKGRPLRMILIGFPLTLGAGLISERYVWNLLRYGSPMPNCEALYGFDECYAHNPIFRRGVDFAANTPEILLSPYAFVGRWLHSDHVATVGYFGHTTVHTYDLIESVTFGLVLILAGSLIRHATVTVGDRHDLLPMLATVGGLYIALVFYRNYSGYTTTGIYGVALQGRYLFPVIFPVTALGIHRIGSAARNFYPLFFGPLILVFALSGSIPYLVRAPSEVYRPELQSTAAQLREILLTITSDLM